MGVPSNLETFKKIHKEFGKLNWKEIIKPVIELSNNGFIPPNRLVNALKKDRFFKE